MFYRKNKLYTAGCTCFTKTNPFRPARLAFIFLFLIALGLTSSIHGSPLDNWHLRNPLPQANNLNAITFGGGKFVAVGDAATVSVSTDGIHWANFKAPKSSLTTLASVTSNDGTYVAVGIGVRDYSFDGTNWLAATPNTSGLWSGVTWGNGMFVSVGTPFSTKVGISTSITNWIDYSATNLVYLSSVTYGENIFLGAFTNGIFVSPDATNWSKVNSSTGTTNLAYLNGSFWAVGRVANQTAILSSIDGTNWNTFSTATTNSLHSIAFGQGIYTAVGEGIILTSNDGTNWTSLTNSFSLGGVAYGNGIFVAVGKGGVVLNSIDGQNWNTISSGPRTAFKAITCGDRFVAVGTNGLIATSDNGADWTVQNSGVTENFFCAAAGNNRYVAGSSTGGLLSSTNGIDWIYRNVGHTNGMQAAAYGNGCFVFTVGTRFVRSVDGDTWTVTNTPLLDNLPALTFGNGIFLAAGDNAAASASSDGIYWNTPIPFAANKISVLIYGRGVFVARDSKGFIYTSSDGAGWTNWGSTDVASIVGAAYGFGDFVMVDSSDIPHTSGDTTNWTLRSAFTGVSPPVLRGIAFGKNTFVVVGDKGTIYQSDPLLSLQLASKTANSYSLATVGEIGPSHGLQVSTNLATWQDYTNFSQIQSSVLFTNMLDTNSPSIFYRIKPE